MTLRDLANKPGTTIIDVREPWEFAAGHIDGAINIPLDTLKADLTAIDRYPKPVLLVCESGNRSRQAHDLLVAKGIAQVYDAGPWRDVRNMIFRTH